MSVLTRVEAVYAWRWGLRFARGTSFHARVSGQKTDGVGAAVDERVLSRCC